MAEIPKYGRLEHPCSCNLLCQNYWGDATGLHRHCKKHNKKNYILTGILLWFTYGCRRLELSLGGDASIISIDEGVPTNATRSRLSVGNTKRAPADTVMKRWSAADSQRSFILLVLLGVCANSAVNNHMISATHFICFPTTELKAHNIVVFHEHSERERKRKSSLAIVYK